MYTEQPTWVQEKLARQREMIKAQGRKVEGKRVSLSFSEQYYLEINQKDQKLMHLALKGVKP